MPIVRAFSEILVVRDAMMFRASGPMLSVYLRLPCVTSRWEFVAKTLSRRMTVQSSVESAHLAMTTQCCGRHSKVACNMHENKSMCGLYRICMTLNQCIICVSIETNIHTTYTHTCAYALGNRHTSLRHTITSRTVGTYGLPLCFGEIHQLIISFWAHVTVASCCQGPGAGRAGP
jgi:hypothetical protein